MSNKYGCYDKVNSAFHINTADIPRNWYNYLWNDNYISFVSQTGAGNSILQDDMGRRIKLIEDRCLFVLEGDSKWGISGLPVEEARDEYSCTHNLGYTTIHTRKSDIVSDVTFFVMDKKPCELWKVKLKNASETGRRIRVMGYFGTEMDGAYDRQGYNTGVAEWDDRLKGLAHLGYCSFYGVKGTPYYGYMTMTETADGYSGTANAFIGPYGSFSHPLAVREGKLINIGGNGEKLGFALSKDLFLEPLEEKELTFICGIAFDIQEAVNLRQDLLEKGAVDKELECVKAKFTDQILRVYLS